MLATSPKHFFLRLFSATALSALLVACATTRQVYLPRGGYAIDVNVGEKVEVVMQDGTKRSFKVSRVDENGLSGSEGSFAYSEMQSVNVVEQSSGWKRYWWVPVTIAAIVLTAEWDDSAYGPFCLYSSNDPSRKCL